MDDLRNVALTLEAGSAAEQLKAKFGLVHTVELARLGFAYAIRHGLTTERDVSLGAPGGSNYNIGTLDPDQELRDAVRLFFPSHEVAQAPYRAIETLMNKGLLLLGEHIKQGLVGTLEDVVASECLG
ncbi:hypothetical protein ACWGCW_06870 [Streptomyces sp. NPDC054933]